MYMRLCNIESKNNESNGEVFCAFFWGGSTKDVFDAMPCYHHKIRTKTFANHWKKGKTLSILVPSKKMCAFVSFVCTNCICTFAERDPWHWWILIRRNTKPSLTNR